LNAITLMCRGTDYGFEGGAGFVLKPNS